MILTLEKAVNLRNLLFDAHLKNGAPKILFKNLTCTIRTQSEKHIIFGNIVRLEIKLIRGIEYFVPEIARSFGITSVAS